MVGISGKSEGDRHADDRSRRADRIDATAELQHLIRVARHDLGNAWTATSRTALKACLALPGEEHRILRVRLFAGAVAASRNLGLVEMAKEWGWVTAMQISGFRGRNPSVVTLRAGRVRVLAAHIAALEEISRAAKIDLPEDTRWEITE